MVGVKNKNKVKQILIVEDDKDMQEIYEDMFGDERDYKVDIVDRAAEALRKLQEKNYHLVILDIIMEPVTGDSLFLYIRADKKTKETPVLVVSVLSPVTMEKLKRINHIDFLQKPISRGQLIEKIEKMTK
ncbi:MAG: response regulator [bacterium]